MISHAWPSGPPLRLEVSRAGDEQPQRQCGVVGPQCQGRIMMEADVVHLDIT